MGNQTKSKKKSYHSHKRRESDDKNAVAIVKFVPIGLRLARLGNIGFSKWKTVPGKPDAKSLGIDSKSTVLSVYATSSKYAGKKGPSIGKIQVKNPHQRDPYARKFEDRSHAETKRQQRCARSKAWNLAENIYKLKEKDMTTFYSPAEE